MGLLSPGSVHAHQDHFLAVIAGLVGGVRVAIHGFTDGRDLAKRRETRFTRFSDDP